MPGLLTSKRGSRDELETAIRFDGISEKFLGGPSVTRIEKMAGLINYYFSCSVFTNVETNFQRRDTFHERELSCLRVPVENIQC